VLGAAVGGIIVFTNTRTILRALDVTDWAANTIYAFIVGVRVVAVTIAIARVRRGTLPREAVVDETTSDRTTETTTAP
jgi:hypothetical protein